MDEEELLGFHVFVAELELLVSKRRGQKEGGFTLDFNGALVEVLQKLVVSVDHTSTEILRSCQGRCEQVLTGVLLKGACPEVQQLICKCLGKMYRANESLQLYSEINTLQAYLLSKEGLNQRSNESCRLGALDCLTQLCLERGPAILSFLPSFVALADKHASRSSNSISVRVAALQLTAASVCALGSEKKSSQVVQEEALRLAERNWKVKEPETVRLASYGIISSLARVGGSIFWQYGGTPFEDVAKACASGLGDASQAVGIACGEALGELAAATRGAAAQNALSKEMKMSRRTALEKVLSQGLQRCIIRPFVEAAVFSRKDTSIAVAKAWVSYIDALSIHSALEESEIVELAMQVMSTLAAASAAYNEAKAKGLLEDSIEFGFGMSGGELPVAQATVLYVFRVAILRRLSETGQRLLADKLMTWVASIVGGAVPVAVGGLAGVQVLLEVLGEIPDETSRSFEAAVMEKLVSSSSAVRSQAAGTLGSIARADPGCASRMISTLTDYLKISVAQLTSLSAPYGASHPLPWSLIPGSPGSPGLEGKKADETTNIKVTMHAVYGHSIGLAAVLVASRYTPLGVPSHLYESAFSLAKELILFPKSPVPNANAVGLKAGYCVLGALCVGFPDVVLNSGEDLLSLWEPAFGELAKSVMTDTRYQRQKEDVDLAMQLWWRASALESCKGYLEGILLQNLTSNWKTQLERLVSMLSPMVAALSASTGFQDPTQAAGGPGGWVAGSAGYLQLRLLEVYSLIPVEISYRKDHEALVKLCSKSIRGPTGLLSSSALSIELMQSTLRNMLEIDDSSLSSWTLDHEPLDEQLVMMSGHKGAPQCHPWEGGMGTWGVVMAVGKGRISAGVSATLTAFPQAKNLSLSLLGMQLKILGRLLWRVTVMKRIQLLELLLNACKRIQGRRKASKMQHILFCVCCTALSGFQRVKQYIQGNQSDEVGQKLLELAYTILDACGGDHVLRRAAGELIGYAALVGSDAFAIRCAKRICGDLKGTMSAIHRSGLALGLGSIFRLKGGMSMQSILPAAIDVLFLLMRRPTADIHFWAFHGLLLVANAAGLSYLPYVKNSLQLAQELMMSNLEVERLRPFVGRMTNAMVAVLGPELAPDGGNFRICKILMRLMETGKAARSVIESAQATSAALELVLYAQQLVLFAPQAVPAERHIPILMNALLSPHPSLRYAAATTLRQIVGRNAEALGKSDVEVKLFYALDEESESHIASALQATLSALLSAQCPSNSHRWVVACSDIVAGLGKKDSSHKKSNQEGGMGRDVDSILNDHDDEHQLNVGDVNSQSSKGPSRTRPMSTPRIKTKLFACECLLKIFDAVGDNLNHFDLIKAMQSGESIWLVQKLGDLVKLGFTLATGQVEALRPFGVQLLNKIIVTFISAGDPEVEDAKLLFQYQAQFVSPLRMALASDAPPPLFMHGATLAVSFLKSGLAGEDVIVLKQLMGLLVTPLLDWDGLQYQNCSEWVGAQVRVKLLEAHAHCSLLADEAGDVVCKEIVRTAQDPILHKLRSLWFGVLMDYAVLSRWKDKIWDSYSPCVITVNIQNGAELDMDALHDAWPILLQALGKNLPSAEDIKSVASVYSQSPVQLIVEASSEAQTSPVDGTADLSVSASSTAASAGDTVEKPQTPSISFADKEEAVENAESCAVGPQDDFRMEDPQESGNAPGPLSITGTTSETEDTSRHLATIKTRLTDTKEGFDKGPRDLYWRLLDITAAQLGTTAMAVIELYRSDEADPQESSISPMLVCIGALRKMLTGQYLELDVCSVNLCVEVLEMLTSILQQVVHPLLSSMPGLHSSSLVSVVSSSAMLLKDMCTSVQPSAFDIPSFVRTAMDLILCCTSILSSDQTLLNLPQGTTWVPEGLCAAFGAASAIVQSSKWSMVSDWLGVLLQQGLHVSCGNHTKQVYSAVRDCTLVCCKLAWKTADSGGSELPSDSTPDKLVIWMGSRVVQEVTKQVENTESQETVAFHPRCISLISTLFELVFLTSNSTHAHDLVSEFCNNILALLASCLELGRPTVVHSIVLESLRELVQECGSAENGTNSVKRDWCIASLVKVGPLAACAVQESLVTSTRQLTGGELQVVAETFKLFFLSVSVVEDHDHDSQNAILKVLLPLLIEAVDPPNPTPALIDMALKLINRLSVGPASSPFRQVIADLPSASKLRLQQALKKTAPKPQEGSFAKGKRPGTFANIGNVAKPSIVLKTQFAKPT